MSSSPPIREVTLVLPMAPDMELVASQAASALAGFVGMSPDRVDEVRMAVVEACINAFEHSHAAERKVDITFRVRGIDRPESLEITVHDNGVGFAPGEVEDPHIEEKLRGDRKRGWGLKIIQGLMDEVRIQSGSRGTTVIMSKSR
ncbi:MAG: ATP-binding protein [Thermoanaerobaculia bacterium]|jgi:serine/threonine-protein kinase RsbW|nr:MAG: ATP-binding protein [Thermoanaerobaculia bacterium]MBZ0100854.1 ATP-binding protein [Thermoanaerobaculia bacterium]